ncbi:MAG: hypothetical protein EBS01_00460 [Verrucomicrobia bacterium]|nr:hypothetical protein [Verrucomicrobiota bacterium]
MSLASSVQSSFAADPEFRIWLEAKSMAGPVTSPIPGAARTILCAGRLDGAQLHAFSRPEWLQTGLSWVQLERLTLRLAAEDLEKCTVRFRRDRRGVIVYASIICEQSLVHSAVLAPDFDSRFSDTLGDAPLLTVPNRNEAFVFPQLGPDLARYSDMVLDAYRDSTYPVSVEVFEVSRGRLRGVGVLERQR